MQKLQLITKIIKQKVFTKVIQMPSWKAWVQGPSVQIKVGGSATAFKGEHLDGRECFIRVTINNWLKSLYDT
jgi:hypothetical protein